MQRPSANKRSGKSSGNTLAAPPPRLRPFSSPTMLKPQKEFDGLMSRGVKKKWNDEKANVGNFLTKDLVIRSIISLCDDGIRPLLPDVVQRIKYLSKDMQAVDRKVGKLNVALLYSFIECKCHASVRLLPFSSTGGSSTRTSVANASNTRSSSCRSLTPVEKDHSQHPNYILIEAALIPHPHVKPHTNFIDPHDPHNAYPEITWRSFYSFLLVRLSNNRVSESRDLMPYQFKGGRYGLATELQKSEFPFLSELRLAQLCHLVQLAIEGGLLAYENSSLQPVSSCRELNEVRLLKDIDDEDDTDSVTEALAFVGPSIQQPRSRVFNTVEELVQCLETLLLEKPGGVVLAQLRKKLLAKFQRELIPERLGYRKLTDCLMAPLVQSVAQIQAVDPNSHRLIILHRQFTTQSSVPALPSAIASSIPIPEILVLAPKLEQSDPNKKTPVDSNPHSVITVTAPAVSSSPPGSPSSYSASVDLSSLQSLLLLNSPGAFSVSTAVPSDSASILSTTPDFMNVWPSPMVHAPERDDKQRMKIQSHHQFPSPNPTHPLVAVTTMIHPPIPLTAMSRSPAALTPISFLFLARSKRARHLCPFRFSPSIVYSRCLQDGSDDDGSGNDTPFYATRIALQEMQKLTTLSTATIQHTLNTTTTQHHLSQLLADASVYWDCLLPCFHAS